MRKYDWQRRQKKALSNIFQHTKQMLEDAGFKVSGLEYYFGIRAVNTSDGFSEAFEVSEGVMDYMTEFKEFKELTGNEYAEGYDEGYRKAQEELEKED